MLEIVSKNKDYKSGKVLGVYEIASVYSKKDEITKMSGLIFGGEKETTFKYVKGMTDTIFGSLSLKNISYIEDKGNSAKIFSGKKEIGYFVNLDDAVTKRFKVKSKGVWFFELDLMTLSELSSMKKFKNIPRFPGSERDLTLVVEEKVTAAEFYEIINRVKSGIRANVEVIDIYRGKGLPEDKKSVSVRFIYQAKDRTLTDKEVDDDQSEIIKKTKDVLGGILRGEGS
jgi:phenylalanyl-tRNA synthetase beta chain